MKLTAAFVVLLLVVLLHGGESGWRRRWKKIKKTIGNAVNKWAAYKGLLSDMRKIRATDRDAYDEVLEELRELFSADRTDEDAQAIVDGLDQVVNNDESNDELDEYRPYHHRHHSEYFRSGFIGHDHDSEQQKEDQENAIESLQKILDAKENDKE